MRTTLESIEETENKRRQMLMEDLDSKDAQLYDARKEIRHLGENPLLAIKHRQPLWSKFRCPSPPFHQLSSLRYQVELIDKKFAKATFDEKVGAVFRKLKRLHHPPKEASCLRNTLSRPMYFCMNRFICYHNQQACYQGSR